MPNNSRKTIFTTVSIDKETAALVEKICKRYSLKKSEVVKLAFGYIDNENFKKWMEKLSKKLTVIGQDLKSLINTDTVLDDNEKILDNQDLAFLLKVSFRTLQRYRVNNQLPYFTIGRKTYYRAVDIRTFVRERADFQTYKRFEKDNQLTNQP